MSHVAETSMGAYLAQGNTARRTKELKVLDVVRQGYNRERIVNMTCGEITRRLQSADPGGRWHEGGVSARLAALVDKGQLVRCEASRLCTVSGSNRQCFPVMLPHVQERLVP